MRDQSLYIVAVTLLNSFIVINASPFYCQDGSTQTISGLTTGLIKTRQAEEGFSGNNLRCSWVIAAEPGHKIKLSVQAVDLQWSPKYTTCNDYDYLKILEGDVASGIHIASVCHARSPHNVISQGSTLYLVYSTTQQDFGQHRGIEVQFDIFANDSCPPGWFQAADTADDCMMVGSLGQEIWVDSQDVCHYSRSNLASVMSEAEYTALLASGRNMSIERAWIGLSELQSEGMFKWVDKQPLQYERTKVGYGYRTHCIAQNFRTGDWDALNCDDNQLNYVCKAKRDGSTVLYPAVPASTPPAEGSEGTKLYIVVVVVVVLIVVAGIFVIIFLLYLRRNKKWIWSRSRSQSRSRERTGPTLTDIDTGNALRPVTPPSYAEVMGYEK